MLQVVSEVHICAHMMIDMTEMAGVQGASTILYAACEPTLSGRGGAYFHDCKEETPSDMALDTSLAKALWEATESMLENRAPVKQRV
jgi:hypothetical protein